MQLNIELTPACEDAGLCEKFNECDTARKHERKNVCGYLKGTLRHAAAYFQVSAQKERLPMTSTSQPDCSFVPHTTQEAPSGKGREDRTYQAVTVMAILLLIASLWVF